MIHFLKERIKADKNTSIIYVDPKGGEYDFGVVVDSYRTIKDATSRQPFTLRVPAKRIETFDWLAEWTLEVASRNKGRVIFAVDEAQKFSNKHWNSEGFELLTDEGGFRGLDIYLTTHRPGDIHGNLKAAADRIIVFQTHHSRDIGSFQEYIDVPDEVFKGLKRDQYIEWHVQSGYRVQGRRQEQER